MNFKPFLPMALSLVLAASGMAQSPRIVVQGPGAPSVHTDLATALSAAQPGDHVYLSGGVFPVTASLIIDKQVHMIGAGIHPDTANVTATTRISITGDLRLLTSSSGSTFTGISFNPSGHTYFGTNANDDDPVGLVFQRCEFVRGSINLQGSGGSTGSATFDECVLHATGTNQNLNGGLGEVVITRCIFNNRTINSFSRLFLKNSVILNARLTNSSNAIVQNCVFTYNGAPLWQVNGVQISNCLVAGSTMFSNSSSSSETNNIYNVPVASMFVNETDNVYQYSDDLHLAPGSGGVGMGNDGSDIGVYGTHAPMKAGLSPYNPHFQQAQIAPSTDWNGALPVNIRTAAQTH